MLDSELDRSWTDGMELTEAVDRLAAIDRAMARIEFTPDGTILDANKHFLAAVGYTLDEVKGKHHSVFIFDDEKATAEYAAHWTELSKGTLMSGEYRRRRKDGSELWISASYSPVFGADGKPYKVVKYASDISSRVFAVNEIGASLARLAEGDLSTSITATFSPEFDSLRINFNEAQAKLAHAMHDLIHVAVEIQSSTQKLSDNADELANRTEKQSSSVAETASSIRELSAQVDSHKESAQIARDMVQKTQNRAEAGSSVMIKARDAMDGIAESSTEISKITSVINQIAFQTNLLALNAGVEAARAGEAGRGFAVVASEVRDLAQRSSDAAAQIAGLIEKSSSQVKEGVDLVSKTNESLTEISEFVSDALSQVSEIAEGTSQQADTIRTIDVSASAIDGLTQQNAAMFEETKVDVQALATETNHLRDAIRAFKLNDADMKSSPRQSLTG